MKKCLVACLMALSFSALAGTGNVDNCTFNGIKLHLHRTLIEKFCVYQTLFFALISSKSWNG